MRDVRNATYRHSWTASRINNVGVPVVEDGGESEVREKTRRETKKRQKKTTKKKKRERRGKVEKSNKRCSLGCRAGLRCLSRSTSLPLCPPSPGAPLRGLRCAPFTSGSCGEGARPRQSGVAERCIYVMRALVARMHSQWRRNRLRSLRSGGRKLWQAQTGTKAPGLLAMQYILKTSVHARTLMRKYCWSKQMSKYHLI